MTKHFVVLEKHGSYQNAPTADRKYFTSAFNKFLGVYTVDAAFGEHNAIQLALNDQFDAGNLLYMDDCEAIEVTEDIMNHICGRPSYIDVHAWIIRNYYQAKDGVTFRRYAGAKIALDTAQANGACPVCAVKDYGYASCVAHAEMPEGC